MSFDGEVIRSMQNKYVSLARSLGDRKHREKSSLYRFDGVKLMCEAISRGVQIRFILICESQYELVFGKALELYGIEKSRIEARLIVVEASVFEKLSEESAPEGVICVAEYDEGRHRELNDYISCDSYRGEKLLLIESVRDPQNIGAIIRVATAFGVDRIIMSRDCADIYNGKTVRASMGSLFSVKIDRVSSISEVAEGLTAKGRRVYAAALDEIAVTLGELEVREGDCVIIGNEGHGISPETIEKCTSCVYIPMSDGVESLNAATAAAVIVWEFFGKSRV